MVLLGLRHALFVLPSYTPDNSLILLHIILEFLYKEIESF